MKFVKVAIILLVALGCSSAQNNAISISFFSSSSGGITHSSKLLTECEQLPSNLHDKLRYVTTEACVELHTTTNCNEHDRHLPVNKTANKFDLGAFGKKVVAFKPCVPIPGPYQDQRIKIYGNSGLLNDLPIEFKDNCTDFPVSIRNHANVLESEVCMTLFDELGCKGVRVRMQRPYPFHFSTLPAKSYSVCNKEQFRYVPEMPTVHAKVVGARFTVTDTDWDYARKQTLSIEGTEVFRNNGNVPVKQLHKVSKSIEEDLHLQRLDSLMAFDMISTAEDVTFSTPHDIPTFAWDKIKQSFKKAYARQTPEKSFKDITEKVFSMEQTLEIPSCSSYEVTSVVNFAEGYGVYYGLTVEVTGEWGRGRSQRDMTAEELKEKIDGIDGITYRSNKVVNGKNVAEAWARGDVILSFGYGIEVKGVGLPLADCINY